MKKIFKTLLFFVVAFISINKVNAEKINSITMDIFIESNGDAKVTEIWNATPSEKTEYYHAYYNIGNSQIKDLKVKDETREYTYKNWNINESFNEKAYHYGYNYTNNGVELCFGKSSYQTHTYTMEYTITNFVSNTSDGKQMIYWNLLDSINPAPGNVEITISSDTYFEDDVDVWGYGNYGGLAYVSNGKIYASNDHLTTSDYMVLLVKLDEDTFEVTNTLDKSFDEYSEMAEDGATSYSEKKPNKFIQLAALIFSIVVSLISFIFPVLIMVIVMMFTKQTSDKSGKTTLDFGETGKSLPKDVNMFRDIPCNKDIYRAYWVAKNYGLMRKQTDFLGAIILKWRRDEIIGIENNSTGKIFKKEETTIVFKTPTINSGIELEDKLYSYMYEASKDGILESKEFERWCKKHYDKILKWFDKVLDYVNEKLEIEGKLTKGTKKVMLFTVQTYQVDPSMKEEAIQMKGLKQFFKEFDNMSDKEAIQVMLWQEYLMYAQIFGVADKVAKQFKKLYPEVITDYNYESVMFINDISYHGMHSATSARSAASSYSGGGGGFSSGGGGGGSFGGGGGGSR